MRLPDAETAERALPRLLGAMVVAFTCGSSAVIPLLNPGRVLRWLLLIAVAGLAVRWAVSRRPRASLPALPAAAAAALVVLAFVSTGWTVRSFLTPTRTASLAIMFAAAIGLAAVSAGRPDVVRRLLLGILGGAIVVAVVGVALLPIAYGDAVQGASRAYPARFRGLGENPNTVSLLLGVTMPLALWQAAAARSDRARLLFAAVVVLFFGSIVAAGSRGGLVAALVGTVVFVLATAGSRVRGAALAFAAICAAAAALAVMQIPSAKGGQPPKPMPTSSRDAERLLPLDGEIGRGPLDRPRRQVRRSAFTTSGRLQAWGGALGQGFERPVLGYGFGTEGSVFADRFYEFYSASPENTYVGTFLQLGFAGLAVFLTLIGSLLRLAARAVLTAPIGERPMRAAATATFVAAIVAALTQSYLLAVGNLSTAAVWICAFLATSAASASAASGKEMPRRGTV